MALQRFCSYFEILFISTFLIISIEADPHYGYVYQKPNPFYANYKNGHNNLLSNIQARNTIMKQNTGQILNQNYQQLSPTKFTQGYQYKKTRSYRINGSDLAGYHTDKWPLSSNHISYGNLYDSMKTSYDVPLFPNQNSIDYPKNYDTSEYKQILNEVYHKQNYHQYLLPVKNDYGSNIVRDNTHSAHVLDANVLKIIENILLKEELKEEARKYQNIRPHTTYGPPPYRQRIVNVKLESPVKSILVKEGLIHR